MKEEVIRAGDTVKVINPEFFLRCGYPLSLQDGVNMLLKDEAAIAAIENGINTALGRKKYEAESISHILSKSYKPHDWHSGRAAKDFRQIIKILAYYKIANQGFGGKERKIYTKRVEEAKDHTFTVLSKRTVVTGNYIPASGNWSYYGEYDYDPAYLENQKSHVILYLYDGSVDGEFYYVSNTIRRLGDNDFPRLAIEKCNVEKVITV